MELAPEDMSLLEVLYTGFNEESANNRPKCMQGGKDGLGYVPGVQAHFRLT